MNKTRLFFSILFSLVMTWADAQVVDHPNQAMKSPEPLVVDKIVTGNGQTTLFLTIENKIKDGYFCADKRIYLVYPDGTRQKLIRAEGIPVCPDYHKFSEPGEKLEFSLVFPAVKEGTPWVDMVEECESGCMFFYGLTLDQEMNRKLDDLFTRAEKTTPEESINLFKSMIDEIDSKKPGIEGLLYINIISASVESGDKVGASVWYRRMLISGIPRLSYYIKYLNDKGVRF